MQPLSTAPRPILGLGTLLSLLVCSCPASAQVAAYGSGINPPGSLVVISGTPMVGESFRLGVANTASSLAGQALAFL